VTVERLYKPLADLFSHVQAPYLVGNVRFIIIPLFARKSSLLGVAFASQKGIIR
jgi:hypothetical protein